VGGIKNGALLKLIEGEGLHVFLTGDKNVQNQRQLRERPFAVLVMSAINWPVVQTHVSKISDAIDATEAERVSPLRSFPWRGAALEFLHTRRRRISEGTRHFGCNGRTATSVSP